MRTLLSLTFTLLLMLSAQAQTGLEIRQFRDWTATCTKYEGCTAHVEAIAKSDTADKLKIRLNLSRGNYDTYWQISLTSRARMIAEKPVFTLGVENTELQFAGQNETGAYGQVNRFYLLGDKAQTLLDNLIAGANAQIGLQDENGTQLQATASLSGLAATLLWIDEKQTRIGSERVAGEPPENIKLITTREPAPPSEKLLALHAASDACDVLEDLPNGNDGASYRLDAETTLHIIPCWAGAYNFGARIYTQTEDNFVTHQVFADYSEARGWMGMTELVNTWYDPATMELSAFYKGRGIADCGSSGLWRWGGYSFNMLEYTNKDDCDGQGNPGEFPVVYRAPGYEPETYDY